MPPLFFLLPKILIFLKILILSNNEILELKDFKTQE